MNFYLTLFSISTLISAQYGGGSSDHEDALMIKKWKLIEFLDISEDQSDKFFTRINAFEKDRVFCRKEINNYKQVFLKCSLEERIKRDKNKKRE